MNKKGNLNFWFFWTLQLVYLCHQGFSITSIGGMNTARINGNETNFCSWNSLNSIIFTYPSFHLLVISLNIKIVFTCLFISLLLFTSASQNIINWDGYATSFFNISLHYFVEALFLLLVLPWPACEKFSSHHYCITRLQFLQNWVGMTIGTT